MVTLSEAQMPNHTHTLQVQNDVANSNDPADRVWSRVFGAGDLYRSSSNLTAMADAALTSTGGSQAHNNMQPYLTINFIIALVGLYPSRS